MFNARLIDSDSKALCIPGEGSAEGSIYKLVFWPIRILILMEAPFPVPPTGSSRSSSGVIRKQLYS